MNSQHTELLNITLEESAEVIQAISKIFRFGWDSYHPNTPEQSNRQHLEEEIGDLLCMIDLLKEKNIIDEDNIRQATENKRKKLAIWSSLDI